MSRSALPAAERERGGKLDEAERLMKRALAIDEKAHGPDHPNVAIPLNNLALLLKKTNRLQEAEPLMKRALEIWEARFGPAHPELAKYLSVYAVLLRKTNRKAEGEALEARAKIIREKNQASKQTN